MEKPSKLQFIHFNIGAKKLSNAQYRRYSDRTVAVLSTSPKAVKDAAVSFMSIGPDESLAMNMMVGVTFLSKKDNYDKAKGRAEAVKSMAEIDLEIKSVKSTKSHIYIDFVPHQGVDLTVRLNKKTGVSIIMGQLTETFYDY